MTNNKKILIVTECFYPEEFKINDVALSWKDKGYDVDVLTVAPTYPLGKVHKGYKNRIISKDNYKGINIIRVRAVTGYVNSPVKKILKYINFMLLGTIVAIFIGKKYDKVFGFNLGALTDMFPAVCIKKIYKKPVTIWVQDLWPDSVYAYGFKKTKILSIFLNTLVKFVFHNVDNIAISGKGFESKLKVFVKKNQEFHYIPNWPDDLIDNLGSVQLSQDSKVHFTFAGNIGKVQNLENIINAFILLPGNYQKKAQLNIIGDGSHLDFLRNIAKENRSIVFFGSVLRKTIAKYYNSSDFLIISLIDNSIFSVTVPAKMQTYIAAKKPILGFINGESANIINDNNLGFCSNPGEISSISEAFKRSIEMTKDERNKFIENNDKLLNTIFNRESIINNLTKILIE